MNERLHKTSSSGSTDMDGVLAPLAIETDHERRAALICLLTAALAYEGRAAIIGEAESGWFWLEGPDRTITWRAWKEASGGEFRGRTGDRYLGGQVWEHYLGFELYRASVKPIKLSMIRLGSEVIPEDVVIRPGLRYAIVKVTNDMIQRIKVSGAGPLRRSQRNLGCLPGR